MLERDAALTEIGRALDSVADGSGRLIVIEGEAGVGKTRLLEAAQRMASERGLAVDAARGTALERSHPFGLVQRLVHAALQRLTPAERDELRESGAAPAVALTAQVAGGAPPADAPAALAASVYRLYERLAAEQPRLVAIDDLHWADHGSVEALAYLAARVEDLPLALAVAIRRGEQLPGPDPRDAVGESPAAVAVPCDPLSERASARLLESLLGSLDDEFARAAFRATGGNPFLLHELALTVAREGTEPGPGGVEAISREVPASIRRWALRRLGTLGPDERSLARSLAVLEEAELLVAGAHAGLAPEAVRAAADRLAEVGLIEYELPLRFAHPLVRAAIYDELPPGARDEAHHAAAQVLAEREAPAAAVATHLLACEPRGEAWAIEALRAAAAAALERGAAEEAAAALARAVSEPGLGDDPGLLAELGRARATLNDPGALADLERAANAGDARVRIGALGALAQARYLAGDIKGAFESAGAALAEIEPGTGGLAEAELLLGYLMAGRQVPELVGTVREAAAAERMPGGASTPAEVIRRQVVALDAYLTGDRETAATHARWVAARLAGQPAGSEAPSLLAIGPAFVLTGIGEWEASEQVIEDALERARRRGSPLETAQCLHERVWQRWRRGDVIGGLGDAELVFELTAGAWDPAKVPLRVARANLLLERGELAAAKAELDLDPELEVRVPATWGWPWLAFGRAAVALADGQPEAALEQALLAGERVEEIQAASPEYIAWRSLASHAAAAIGDAERAGSLALEELELADRIGAPRPRGTALAALANARPREDRIELLREAEAALRTAGAELLRAHVLLRIGVELRRSRRARDARQPLREALDLGHRTGATALAERALAELRAAGGRPRTERTTGAASLTPREREVALLAARGLGNVEIGERLFITRKTVEGHLRTIFRKLEISSRDQIAGALDR